jgi:ATP-binding cassette subfamily F protein 3
VLSGGERNRLALAKLLLHPANCLLLDEPTNHLDIHAKEVLLDALLGFQGTLILVAHDRYILDRLPEEIIEVGAGTAGRYLGNYEDYLRKRAQAEVLPTATPSPREPAPQAAAARLRRDERTAAVQRRERDAERQRQRQAARRAQQIAALEAAIADKEAELNDLTAMINRPDFHQQHANPHGVFSQYARLREEIDSLYGQLEQVESAAPSAAAS